MASILQLIQQVLQGQRKGIFDPLLPQNQQRTPITTSLRQIGQVFTPPPQQQIAQRRQEFLQQQQTPEARQSRSDFSKDILYRYPLQGAARVVNQLQSLVERQPVKPFQPQTPFAKDVLGQEPITGVAQPGEQMGLTGLPAFLVGGLITGADLTPLSGADDVLVKIAKSNSPKTITKLLKQAFRATDKFTEELTPLLVKSSTVEEVEKLLLGKGVIKPQTASKVAAQTLKEGVPTQERGFIKSVQELAPEIKATSKYAPRSTEELAVAAKNLIKTNFAAAEKMALQGTDESAVAAASELIKHYNNQALAVTDPSIRGALFDKAAEVANAISPKLTEQGRAVQAASILSKMTPEGQVRFAAKTIQKYNEAAKLSAKIPQLTGDQAQYIVKEMTDITRIADGAEKALKLHKLQDYISDLVPSPLWSKVVAVWKAGLLTGLKTSGLNVLANFNHAITETIKDIPAKAVDSIASLFTGKRTIGGVTLKGVGGGVKEGAAKGYRYLKTGFDERNVGAKLDWHRVNFGKSKVAKGLQTYEESIFRMMGAEDQPFYYGAKARSIADQALAEAANKGLKGEAKTKFVNELIASPTDDMLKYATIDAQTAVFQQETYLGSKVGKGIQNIPGIGQIALPFNRTPSAVATQIINYSPVGIVKTIFENAGRGNFDQRLFSQGMGRGLLGTGLLALGAYLASNDMLALDRPAGEREQKLWELENRRPNSIKINGIWRNPAVLGPAGNVLLIGGQFHRAFQDFGSPFAALGEAFAGSAKSFFEQTFLTGINQLTSALSDPSRYAESTVRGLISSVVPTIVGDVARATDTKERRTPGILGSLLAKIPGVRQTLEPQVDVLGNQIGRKQGNPLEIMLDPTRPQKENQTPVVKEFRRLSDAGYKVSPTLLGDKKGYSSLTPQQNTALWERVGDVLGDKLDALFSSTTYQMLADDEKGKLIEQFVDRAKRDARVEAVMTVTQGLEGDTLNRKLLELKESGLMTREVFNAWLKAKR